MNWRLIFFIFIWSHNVFSRDEGSIEMHLCKPYGLQIVDSTAEDKKVDEIYEHIYD